MEPNSFVLLKVNDGARAPKGRLEFGFDSAHVVMRGAVDVGILKVVSKLVEMLHASIGGARNAEIR